MMSKTIYFYAPDADTTELLHKDYTKWVGRSTNFIGWIAPTYFHLKNAGFACEIANTIPEAGIVLADRDTLGNSNSYLNKVMLICAKSDRDYHPSAHLHVVHNPFDCQKKSNAIWNPHFISHWPLPGLVPRNKQRQSLVQNIAYIGSKSQLAPELRSETWINELSDLGCQWLPLLEANQWNDYSLVDVVVAARSFGQKNYLNKGVIKLLNCWRAGVPAILTPETAFLAERNTELDFLIVESLEEAIAAVKKLKSDPELYAAMVENGLKRAQEFTTEKTIQQWVTFFNQVAFPAYEQWGKMPETHKKSLFFRRYLQLKLERMTLRIKRKQS